MQSLLIVIIGLIVWGFCMLFDNDIFKIIITILIVCTCIFSIHKNEEHLRETELNAYNNGICECGGNYKFINYTIGHCSHAYVFQCDSCNKIVEFNTNPLN